MKKLPKKIYVQIREKDTNEEWLQALLPEEVDYFDDGEVGVYELKNIAKKHTTIIVK